VTTNAVLWGALIAYGAAMGLVSPRARRSDEFYAGRRRDGSDVGVVLLTASVVISWVFAKSITNAANLGREYGLVGIVAYAGWYLSIPVAGVVIYRLRTRTGARSLTEWIMGRYGRGAAGLFVLVVLVRLMNEVWSNTAVVGAYFGDAGSAPYLAAAVVFTAMTLFYSLRGGLRSSLLTDGVQLGLGLFLLVFVLALLVPRSGTGPLLTAGEWTLTGGVDLLLVAVLQCMSYPFHDPVLTDRGFVTRPRVMLKAYLVAGAIGASFIVLFGLVGVYAGVQGVAAGQDTPLRVAEAFGVAATVVMTVLMMVSAGSTLDSTLSSLSKAAVVDLGGEGGGAPLWRGWHGLVRRFDALVLGRAVMVGAIALGSLPLLAGATILKATTVSGTMVIGLAPAFLLGRWGAAGRASFHLAFWPGLALGVLHAGDALPSLIALGQGPHAALLGAHVWGTAFVFTGFAAGALPGRVHARTCVPSK
jgi:Na+/proline symporter